MAQNLISVKNLSFSYENAEKSALQNVSLEVNRGDYVAIIGSNGSGKSTLSKLIAGFLPLQEGIVEIQQTGPCTIGYVQQNPKYQVVGTIVEKDTAFGPQVLRLNKNEIDSRVQESLESVDLLEKRKANTKAISLGQTQKLALAGILALHPDILILDEALSMIDPETRESILQTVDDLHSKGKTIIHITHDIEQVKHATRVLVIEKGQKIFDGTKSEFFVQSELYDTIFGVENPEIYKRSTRKHDANQSGTISGTVSGKVSIAFDKICFNYDKVQAVNNVSLAFKSGTITAILGKSGSGKSTLFELGTSLLKPASGKIFLGSGDKTDCDKTGDKTCSDENEATTKKTALALQDAESALFQAVAADDVAFGPENQGLKGAALRERVKQSMDICGVPFKDFKDRSILELSGGEKRKIALAGIIALDDDIIFFDEPTSSLDPKSREHFFKMIQTLADEQNKTIIFSTHRKEDSLAADRTIQLENGSVISDSNPVEIPQFEEKSENLRYKEHAGLLSGLRNTTLGEYQKKNSPVHRMPIVAKSLLFLFLFVGSTIFSNMAVIFSFCFLSVLYAAFADFSARTLLRRMRKILPWILFFFVWQVLLFPVGETDVVFWRWHFLKITDENITSLIRMIFHFFGAMTTISVFVYSTDINEILDGMQKRFHLNVFVFFMLLLRFIPLLSEELSHIVKTQIIREGIKSTKGFSNKVKAILPIIIPLIVQTIRRSSIMAEALEARGMK